MIINNSEFELLDGTYELLDCPICGANKDQMCSIPDPDREGFGIELANYVHKERVFSDD
jgi:hypothetical protein